MFRSKAEEVRRVTVAVTVLISFVPAVQSAGRECETVECYAIRRMFPSPSPPQVVAPMPVEKSAYQKAHDDIFLSFDYMDAQNLTSAECFKKNQDSAQHKWLKGSNLAKVYADFLEERERCRGL